MEEVEVSSGPKRSSSAKGVLLFVLIAVVLGVAGFAAVNQNSSPSTGKSGETAANVTPPPPANNNPSKFNQMLVYGVWSSDNTIIKGLDLSNNKPYELAVLPNNIKKVTIVPPDSLIYINKTDGQDNGAEIVKYSLGTKQTEVLVKADPGYAVDEYQISPNNQYITSWEVQLAPRSTVLYGGKSRLYVMNVGQPGKKNLLYDEVINKPIHYARAVLDDGRVFSDTFIPNSGKGWAYGMSVSDFTGQNKQDIAAMTNGTYAKQPILSPDGTKLLFAGYDGSQGPGTELVNGIRRAIVTPNTVELLDTNTLTRTKLANLSNRASYDKLAFDKETGNIVLSQSTPPNTMTDLLYYDLATNNVVKIPNSTGKVFVASFSPEMLVSTPNASDQTLGNLGTTYQYVSSSYSMFDPTTFKYNTLPTTDVFMQTIGVVPSAVISADLLKTLAKNETRNDQGLQLKTFFLKSKLLPQRVGQQNAPIPAAAGGGHGGGHTTTPHVTMTMTKTTTKVTVTQSQSQGGEDEADCKPVIYLYPTKTQDVNVRLAVNGLLTYTIPFYVPGGWDVQAEPTGKLTTKTGQVYDYLYYEAQIPDSYLQGDEIKKKGYVVAYNELGGLFDNILPKLGLSGKESGEFKEYWLKALPSSAYYRVSVVPQKTLDTFAKLHITPNPDTLIRVTLVFEALDKKVEMTPPALSSLERNGFTVVEWAGIFKAHKDKPFTCLM